MSVFGHELSCSTTAAQLQYRWYFQKRAFKLNTVHHFYISAFIFCSDGISVPPKQVTTTRVSKVMTETSIISSFSSFTFFLITTPGSRFSQCRHCKAVFPPAMLYLHVYCVLLLSLILGVSLHFCSLKEQLCHKGTLDKYICPKKRNRRPGCGTIFKRLLVP